MLLNSLSVRNFSNNLAPNLMNKKLVIICIIFSRTVLSSNDSGPLNAYYNCLSERYKAIVGSEHMRAIVCYSGEECFLDSNSCKRFNSIKTTVKWIRSLNLNNSKITQKILNDSHYFIDFITNNLKILDISKNDQGVYEEVEYNATVIKYYHVTVLERSLAYPVYANLINVDHELAFKTERIFLPGTKIEIFTYLTNVSECICTEYQGNDGYRTNDGQCFLRVDGQEIKSELEMLIYRFSNQVPCFSRLISRFSEIKSNSYRFRSILLYRECLAYCFQNNTKTLAFNLDLNNQFTYDGFEIVSAYKDSMVILKCVSVKNVQWRFGNFLIDKTGSNFPGDRISMDKFSRLVIKKVLEEDETNFTCLKSESIAEIYFLKVEYRTFDMIYNFLNKIGIYSLMVLLVLITCFSRASK
ncbi:hypothetical protein BpHYR1_028329 [Brachionus plicatilis]|uniref:Ig-like domain-containing protein n=1 Tax=Brachionus plicatilis TaxID=10195 RepID=A0A3M7R461_BRAPC|nr:hypothetical protein BpHYR1_028329 [Brachionus plicatilis]